LARRPSGLPALEDFALKEAPMPAHGPGEVLVRNLYLSLDPAIRGWMSDAQSYLPPIRIGDPVRSGALAEVIASNREGLLPGDIIQALAAWEEYSVLGEHAIHGKVAPIEGIPLESSLSVLGGTGLTAYFGLLEIGAPKPGETVLVTAAAGAVGSIVGQLAKLHGCRAVGIAGGREKCEWLTGELGFDAAIDYRSGDLRARLKEACPKGVDVFFDCVGGEQLDLGLARINLGARVVICGAISQINAEELPPGPSNYVRLIAKRARMQGFVTFDYAARFDAARAELARHIFEGNLRYRDDVVVGLESAPRHLLRLFDGSHRGKLMVKITDPGEVER
ncbi:MAG: NADP-dependent oxidoreductase, partial [Polyangiaceae bacterium]|nr:NADP-dependent oxidoreductase [Polyangiaceae bacterium]